MIEFLAIGRIPPRNNLHLLEWLCMAAVYMATVSVFPSTGFEAGAGGAILFLALFLAHHLPRPWMFQAAAFLGMFILPTAFVAQYTIELRKSAALGIVAGQLGDTILFPFWVIAWRKILMVAIPFLLGASLTQPRFRHGRFILGYLAGTAILTPILYPREWRVFAAGGAISIRSGMSDLQAWGGLSGWMPPGFALLWDAFSGLLLCVLAVSFRRQREGLERSLGLDLGSRMDREPAPPGFAAAILARANLVLMLGLVPLFAVHGAYERLAYRSFAGLPTKDEIAPPGAVNAIEGAENLYFRSAGPNLEIQTGMRYGVLDSRDQKTITIRSDVNPEHLSSAVAPAQADEAIAQMDLGDADLMFKELEPYIRVIERGASADGVWLPTGGWKGGMNYINYRVVARALAFRSMIRMKEGDVDGALRDLDLIFALADILHRRRGELVTTMIGVAVRNIGLWNAYNYYLRFRQDPAALAKLEELLVRLRSKARVFVDFRSDSPREICFGPVVPFADIVVPGFARATTQSRSVVVKYDQLRIALVLERFRAARGKYPEALEDIEGAALEPLPRDPYDGSIYDYENLGEDFVLLSRSLASAHRADTVTGHQIQLPFPVATVRNDFLEDELRKVRNPAN